MTFIALTVLIFFGTFCGHVECAEIRTLHVISEIQARFAISDVLSIIENTSPRPEEITFYAQLPENAFISNFSMEINGQLVIGDVREKEQARVAYEEARRRGQSAGHVGQDPRETNSFLISVNAAPYSKITFVLTYQEVLRRAHGVYKHVVNVQPQGPVDDLQVDVLISEKKPITLTHIPQFAPRIGERTNQDLLRMPADPRVQVQSHNQQVGSLSYISFNPTRNGQRQQVNGQLVVLYDVERQFNGGEIEVVNGYFVHFIAPEGMAPVPKNVIFVIDKSGSMQGRKMEQTKEAMQAILRDMEYQDRFNVLAFSNDVTPWMPQPVPATPDNINRAVQFLDQLYAQGGTNIYSSLRQALEMISLDRVNPMAMVLLLTDGQPTVGITDENQITGDMQNLNRNTGATIHAIAFGNDADYRLLQRLTAANGGIARKVYEAADANLQITGFINEISNPFLSQVKIRYIDQSVDTASLIEESTDTLYQGGEGIVVGKTNNFNENNQLQATVSGQGKTGPVRLEAFADFDSNGNTIGCVAKPETWTNVPDPRHREILCPGLQPVREQPSPFDQRGPFEPSGPFSPRGTDSFGSGGPFEPIGLRPTQPPLSPASLGGFLEHMWAYLTIKQLLNKAKYEATSQQQIQNLRQRALDMSLKYNFVTELTSMVVIPPWNNGRPVPLLDSKEIKKNERGQQPQETEMRFEENGEQSGDRRPPPTENAKPVPLPKPTALPNGKCGLDIAVVIDTETEPSKFSGIQRELSKFVSEITKKPDTEIRLAVVSLDADRNAKSVHKFSDSQFAASIIRKINRLYFNRWQRRRGSNEYDTIKSTLSTPDGRKKIAVFFGADESLGNFGRDVQLMRQAGVELYGMAVGGKFGQQIAFELKTLAGINDNVFEYPDGINELMNKISCS